MAQSIRIKRRIGGAAGAPATLVVGEMAFNDTGNTLDIGTGLSANADVRRLVGADRQVELTGAQDISGVKTVIAGGGITSPVGQIRITGAAAANSYLRSTAGFATGDLEFGTLPAGGLLSVATQSPILGDGIPTGDGGTPIGLTVATTAQVNTGTDNVFPITSQSLRALTGDVATLNSNLTATTLTGAVNELYTMIAAMTGAIFLIGTWDADGDDITPGLNSPASAGALPAADGDNQGWYLIVDTAGTIAAGHNAPAGNYAVGDWLLSNGAEWLHFQMNLGVIAAVNVTFSAGATGMTATNVQTAIVELHTTIADILDGTTPTATHVDGTSITGLTSSTAAGATAANALTVGVIDGGTF